MADVGLLELVAALGGELIADPAVTSSLRIDRIASLEDATPSSISFLSNPKLGSLLEKSVAGCVIVGPAMRDVAAARGATIITADPYLYYARLTRWWVARMRSVATASIHPSAVIDPSARIAPRATIGALAIVEAEAVIDDGVVIGAQCFIGRAAHIGAQTRFAARVTFNERCTIGERGILHSGVVIGADGFGFAPTEGRWEKIEQLGSVRIGNDVDIGANTCVDRGALGDTVIGDGVKLDNLIQIGHNCRIGEHTAIAGCVGIAGSAVIGAHVMIGGAAMIGGHLTIADNTFISGGSLVSHSLLKAGRYTGAFPIDDNAAWQKNAAVLRHLHTLRDRVRALEKEATSKNATGSA